MREKFMTVENRFVVVFKGGDIQAARAATVLENDEQVFFMDAKTKVVALFTKTDVIDWREEP